MQRILIPLDGSPVAEGALPFGATLARAAGASIEVVHIIEGRAIVDLPTSQLLPDPDRVHEYLHDAAERVIPGVAVESWVRTGDAVDVLLEHATEQPGTMIVLATRGRGGLSRMILGSVADKVVRLSRVPVGLVRPSEDGVVGAADIRAITVALDGSEVAESGLALAVDLACAAGATLHLVEVVEPIWTSPFVASNPDMLAVNMSQLTELQVLAEDDARTYLAATAERLRAEVPDLKVTQEMRVGRAADEINRAAVDAGADLVVVTSHGRGGIRRMVLGSVTTGLIQTGAHPLIVVPARAAGDGSDAGDDASPTA